jgi:hypothetical protein
MIVLKGPSFRRVTVSLNIHGFTFAMGDIAPMSRSYGCGRRLRQAASPADGLHALTERRTVATGDERDGQHLPGGKGLRLDEIASHGTRDRAMKRAAKQLIA